MNDGSIDRSMALAPKTSSITVRHSLTGPGNRETRVRRRHIVVCAATQGACMACRYCT
jgi:hypothetical protein